MKRFSKGFTLIELITVFAILAVVGGTVVGVITITFRGTRKADLLENARQNGDTAMSLMIKNIRFAKSLDKPAFCIAPPASCILPPATVTTKSITITSVIDNQQTTYACANNTISSNSATVSIPLIDSKSINVPTTTCSFTSTQATLLVPPTITIQYILSPANPGIFTETKFTMPFQSTVTLRNFTY